MRAGEKENQGKRSLRGKFLLHRALPRGADPAATPKIYCKLERTAMNLRGARQHNFSLYPLG